MIVGALETSMNVGLFQHMWAVAHIKVINQKRKDSFSPLISLLPIYMHVIAEKAKHEELGLTSTHNSISNTNNAKQESSGECGGKERMMNEINIEWNASQQQAVCVYCNMLQGRPLSLPFFYGQEKKNSPGKCTAAVINITSLARSLSLHYSHSHTIFTSSSFTVMLSAWTSESDNKAAL
jgi:hypothetical protein